MSRNLDVLFTSLQGRYAKALFLEGQKEGCLDEIGQNFDTLENLFLKDRYLERFLSNYSLSGHDSENFWNILEQKLSFCPTFLKFLRIVSDNARLKLLMKIKYIYDIACRQYRNIKDIVIYSVIKLNNLQKKKLEKLIMELFGKKSEIRYEIDEKLLAGIKIFADGVIVDASAIMQIRQLENFCKDIKIREVI